MEEFKHRAEKLSYSGLELNHVNLVGYVIKEGDLCELKTSHKSPPEVLRFKAFNPHLYLFRFEDDEGNQIYIKYTEIKRMKVKKHV